MGPDASSETNDFTGGWWLWGIFQWPGAPFLASFARKLALSGVEGWGTSLVWEKPHFSQKTREMGHPKLFDGKAISGPR